MIALRLDRFASLYLVAPFVGRTARAIPVLMYHSIADGVPDSRHPYYQTTTSVQAFDDQMRFLRDSGYTSVGIGEASQLLDAAEPWGPRKYAVITFDDGFENFHTNAVPVLRKYGATATMYLPTSFIGESPRRFLGLDCLTWSRVRELLKEGITFGSHSVTHPRLCDLGAEALDYELKVSKETIEQNTGTRVESFAYPYAFPEADLQFTQRFKETLIRNDYRFGVCTIIGTASPSSDRLLFPRLPVNSWDDPRLLQAKLEGAYDWLHTLQYAAKRLRRGFSHAA